MRRLLPTIVLLSFLIRCGDNPPASTELTLPDDITIEAVGTIYVLVNAIATDPDRDDMPVNGVKVTFLCLGCQFAQRGDGVSETNLVEWVDNSHVVKRTDEEGVARIWVEVSSGTTAVVSGLLENGRGDDMEVEISAP